MRGVIFTIGVAVVLFSFFMGTVQAESMMNESQAQPMLPPLERVDFHAPIGVVRDHHVKAGQLTFSYRFVYEHKGKCAFRNIACVNGDFTE